MARTEDAVRTMKHEAIRQGAQTLAATVLARISFHRAAVLPELARQDTPIGPLEAADRVRLFANELQCIEKPLRELMAPFERTSGDTARAQLIDAWSVVRDSVESLLEAEASLLDVHSAQTRTERRQAHRVNCDVRALMLNPDQVPAGVLNLSQGGAFVEVPEPLPHIGRLLSLRLFLPGLPLPISTWGEVRRHAHEFQKGRSAIGLRFVDLQPSAGLAIATFLAGNTLKRSRPDGTSATASVRSIR